MGSGVQRSHNQDPAVWGSSLGSCAVTLLALDCGDDFTECLVRALQCASTHACVHGIWSVRVRLLHFCIIQTRVHLYLSWRPALGDRVSGSPSQGVALMGRLRLRFRLRDKGLRSRNRWVMSGVA